MGKSIKLIVLFLCASCNELFGAHFDAASATSSAIKYSLNVHWGKAENFHLENVKIPFLSTLTKHTPQRWETDHSKSSIQTGRCWSSASVALGKAPWKFGALALAASKLTGRKWSEGGCELIWKVSRLNAKRQPFWLFVKYFLESFQEISFESCCSHVYTKIILNFYCLSVGNSLESCIRCFLWVVKLLSILCSQDCAWLWRLF